MKSFSEIDSYTFSEQEKKSIFKEIEGKSKEYILQVDEEEYTSYLINKHTLNPLVVNTDKAIIHEPTKSKELAADPFYHGRQYEREVYYFQIDFPYQGSEKLFSVQPETYVMSYYDIATNDYNKIVSLTIKIVDLQPQVFDKAKQEAISRAFGNVDYVNAFAAKLNIELSACVKSAFFVYKSKYLKENDFFAAINVQVNKSTESIFSTPVLKKVDIPQPSVSKTKQFSSVPTMSNEMYDDVLTVIYNSGKGMERKPSLYIGKDEEGLRDQFLFILETRYEGTTATGETFNRSGKTDIILKNSTDASNLFVAECKFWHGQQGYIDTINQLFDRYLTWRDSKVAIMLFVQNNDFTSVLKNIATTSRTHRYFVKEVGHRGESSFSYIFSLPQDTSKHVFLEVMAFHYDKAK